MNLQKATHKIAIAAVSAHLLLYFIYVITYPSAPAIIALLIWIYLATQVYKNIEIWALRIGILGVLAIIGQLFIFKFSHPVISEYPNYQAIVVRTYIDIGALLTLTFACLLNSWARFNAACKRIQNTKG